MSGDASETNSGNGNGNGRILVAQADIKHLSDQLSDFTKEVRDWRKESDQRVTALEINVATMNQSVTDVRSDVDDLKENTHRWDIFNTLAAIVAALLGVSIKTH